MELAATLETSCLNKIGAAILAILIHRHLQKLKKSIITYSVPDVSVKNSYTVPAADAKYFYRVPAIFNVFQKILVKL